MAKKQLRAGVIGAGSIGQTGHIPGLRAAGVEIAAICDTNLERARDVAAQQGIPGYGGWFTNKDLAGAGALMDIGVHLLDFPKVVAVKGFLSSELGKQAIGLGQP